MSGNATQNRTDWTCYNTNHGGWSRRRWWRKSARAGAAKNARSCPFPDTDPQVLLNILRRRWRQSLRYRTDPARSQQPVEEFYRGKQLDMVIGYSPGGTYDLYARLVARFLGNYIPGKPIIVPRNMPGAGSRLATKWVYGVAPKDGTVLATADQSLSVEQAMGDKQLDLDTTKLVYIGNPNADNNPTATWYSSGIKTIEDAKKRQVVMGATGGSTSSQHPGHECADRHQVQDHHHQRTRQRHQSGDVEKGEVMAAAPTLSSGRRRPTGCATT